MCQFSDKTNNFDFLSPNLPKNGFWGRNFKNQSLDSESAPPIYLKSQFSVKMNNFEFFGLNLGKLPNYVIFWFEYCWGFCRELGGGWNELGGGWNELGEGGWSLVELGAWFGWSWVHSNALLKVVLHTRLNVYWASSGGSRFVTQSLGIIQMVTNKICFMHQFDIPSK